RSAAPRLQRVGGTASRPVATEDAVTITVSVSLPAGTGDVEAALIADELRTRAQRRGAARDGRTTASVAHPPPPAATRPRTTRPRPPGPAAGGPLRPPRKGIASPTPPARRDAEAARRRQLQATAVSPASPSLAPEDSLVIDLFGRRVRIDGQDVDFTHKEFEL